MAQEPITKFNSNSKGFFLGWDAPEVRPTASKSFFTSKIEPVETLSSTRGTKFLEKKNLDISAKVGSSDIHLTAPESTPKITRNVDQKQYRIKKGVHSISEIFLLRHKKDSGKKIGPKKNQSKIKSNTMKLRNSDKKQKEKKYKSFTIKTYQRFNRVPEKGNPSSSDMSLVRKKHKKLLLV